ncbi:MAG: GNAT family N-acetyltransferase [Defluviitaleaceae bacterium]|nr:GNAT family N-acetyltransferase [Defluviitaleaceae bacterium]
MEIIKVEIDSLATEELQGLYAANCLIVEKYGFLKRHRDANEYRDLFLSTFSGNSNELFVIKNGLSLCGIMSFARYADWGGKERYKLTIELCKLPVTKLLVECLAKFVQGKLEEHGQIAITTYNDELDTLIERFSCKVQLRGNTYILDKADIDADLLSKAAEEYQAKNSDLRIAYVDATSEEHIKHYCDLFMELQDDMPDVTEEGFVQFVTYPDKQKQINENSAKRSMVHHCYMIFNAENEPVAMTNVSVNNDDPRFPYQFMIGVKGAYRGRGLGKWLYAAMYKKLSEDVSFEKMFVHHHPTNIHAINISKWVGYKFGYLETTYIADD